MTTATTTQWTSTAGPRQNKAFDKASCSLRWRGKTHIEITDHGTSELIEMCGDISEAALDAARCIGIQFGYELTRDNCKAVLAEYEAATVALVLPEVDNRTTADERAENAREWARMDAKNKVEAEEKAVAVAAVVARLHALYPWAKAEGKLSGQARAAANIRQELKIAFPGVKFSVRSRSFSMGNAVDVSWELGPTPDEVDEITGKYQDSHFDGMQDMSIDDNSAEGEAVGIVLGRSKFVQTHRDVPEAVFELVGRSLCEAQSVEYEGMQTRNVFGAGDYYDDLRTYACRMVSACSVPVGATITGVERGDGKGRNGFYVTFTTPEAAPAPAVDSSPVSAGGCEVQEHWHDKRQFTFWLVVPADRVERDVFLVLRDKCKAAGGWYSRRWGTTPGGFAFEDKAAAEAFAATFGGSPEPDAADPVTDAAPVTRHDARVDKLEAIAARMDADAADGYRERQTNTAKRLGQAMSARRSAGQAERAAGYARAFSAALEAGTLPRLLEGWKLTNKGFLAVAAKHGEMVANGYHAYSVDGAEWCDDSLTAAAVRELAEKAATPEDIQADADRKRKLEIERLENEVRFMKVPGFFPTPAAIAKRVIDEANISTTDRVLEPSAGLGNLAEACPSPGNVDCVEQWGTLADILSAKGFAVCPGDFLEIDPDGWGAPYDKIVMNPPFEHGQDAQHVKHAFGFLKPGGRLVAIMANGAQFAKFAPWLDEVGGWSEELPADAFKGKDAFRQTGVSSRLVVIDK